MDKSDIVKILTSHKGENRVLDVIEKSFKPLVIIDPDEKAQKIVEALYKEKPNKAVQGDIDGGQLKASAKAVRAEFDAWAEAIKESWNLLVSRKPLLVGIVKLSDERRKHLKNRYSNAHYKKNINDVMHRVERSKFLLGYNDRKWTASFDWLISNDTNYLKILEGKYDDRVTQRNGIDKFIRD